MPKVIKPVRTVSDRNTGKADDTRINIPPDMGLKKGDIILFEKVDDKTVKMTKLA